jgi:excinuclease ABC subunit B
MYADRITGSMQRAIDETGRRRELQRAFNLKHGIQPRSVLKSVDEVRLSTRVADAREQEPRKVREEGREPYDSANLEQAIKRIEEEMRAAAAELDFENAARLRDHLFELKAGNRKGPGIAAGEDVSESGSGDSRSYGKRGGKYSRRPR